MVDDANQRHEYALERSQREYERLELQGEILKPMTRRLFCEAGIEPGMRIVDLGSGAGDVRWPRCSQSVGPLFDPNWSGSNKGH